MAKLNRTEILTAWCEKWGWHPDEDFVDADSTIDAFGKLAKSGITEEQMYEVINSGVVTSWADRYELLDPKFIKGIIKYIVKKVGIMNLLLGFIYFLILIVFALGAYAVMQIKLAGMNVKDFWSFIKANDLLDKLYSLSKKCEKMNSQEQIIFLLEAEKMFSAFEKVPNEIWEEEYSKYKEVLDTYRSIRMLRWAEVN